MGHHRGKRRLGRDHGPAEPAPRECRGGEAGGFRRCRHGGHSPNYASRMPPEPPRRGPHIPRTWRAEGRQVGSGERRMADNKVHRGTLRQLGGSEDFSAVRHSDAATLSPVRAELGARSDGEPAPAVWAARSALTAMEIRRVPGPTRVILSGLEGNESLHEVLLTARPSPEWRAAFVRPPARFDQCAACPRRRAGQCPGGGDPLPDGRGGGRRVAPPDRPLDRLRQLGGGGVTYSGSRAWKEIPCTRSRKYTVDVLRPGDSKARSALDDEYNPGLVTVNPLRRHGP